MLGCEIESWMTRRPRSLPACRNCCRNPGSEKALIAALPKLSFPKAGGANERWNQSHTGGKVFCHFSYLALQSFYPGEENKVVRVCRQTGVASKTLIVRTNTQ